MNILLATGLFERIWNDPFDFLWKAVCVIFVLGFLIRFAKEQIEGD